MGDSQFDVVGIGNAIVDIIARCDDDFLTTHGAEKGHMQLVDAAEISKLYDAVGPATEISGGSAANTIAGVASFGGSAAYMGKVADDEFGRIFTHDIRAMGVRYETAPGSGGAPTARSLVLVTPDGERTMNTFLGISPQLSEADVDADAIAAAQVLYLEGYLFDAPRDAVSIDPDNAIILTNHVRCAAFELPFDEDELFGQAQATRDVLEFLTHDLQVLVHQAQVSWFEGHRTAMREAVQDAFFEELGRVYMQQAFRETVRSTTVVRRLLRNRSTREVFDDLIVTSGRPPYEGVYINPHGALHRDPDRFDLDAIGLRTAPDA